jgi:hypothetical protein
MVSKKSTTFYIFVVNIFCKQRFQKKKKKNKRYKYT